MSRPSPLRASRGAQIPRAPLTPTRTRQTSHLSSPMPNRLPTPSMMHRSDMPPCAEMAHREYSLISFEWPINGLECLRRGVDDGDNEQESEAVPELLARGVVIGEDWYKLDMARTIPPPHTPSTPPEHIAAALVDPSEAQSTSLSLYVTSPTLDAAPPSYTFTSSIFVGIRPSSPDIGQRDSYTRWLWHTSIEHEFTKDAEYATITLPPLEELEAMPPATLCVQLGSPIHKHSFTLPGQVLAPTSLILGLAALLDSASGDVEFVCLEHTNDESRKRVLRAHSEILRARSEYFKSLLDGGFKEAEGRGRIVVDDADYATVYWLLHYVYCNELLFSPAEDVRLIMNRLHLDRREVQHVLTGRKRLWSPGEWDYRVIPLEGDEPDLSTSVSLSDVSERAKSASSAGGRSPPKTTESRVPSALVSSVTSRRLGAARPGPSTPTPTPKSALPSAKASSPTHRGKLPARLSDASPDPHSHPAAPPPPASPLSMFMLAHRYRLDVLESLAKERILSGLMVDNCMPMLFATHAYDALHTEVLDYVVDNFAAVQLSTEFHICIKEVSSGVWGETGGKVLVGLFRRL